MLPFLPATATYTLSYFTASAQATHSFCPGYLLMLPTPNCPLEHEGFYKQLFQPKRSHSLSYKIFYLGFFWKKAYFVF